MRWDRKELLIPNKEFITGQVINWTLTDPVQRVECPVGIAYGSDVELATEILKRIATEEPRVIEDPEPRVLFLGFGDNSLNFELRAFVATLEDRLDTVDALHRAVDREFRKAGIEIAFPQRDLHIRSIEAVLPTSPARNPEQENGGRPAEPSP